MAYFDRETYEAKRRHAERVTAEGLGAIVEKIAGENASSQRICELTDELKPIVSLSHKRHEVHSLDRNKLFGGDQSLLSDVGNEFSDGCLIDDVNRLNAKHHLVDAIVPLIGDVPYIQGMDSAEDVIDGYGKTPTGDEDKDLETACQLVASDWDQVLNEWSEKVRAWFAQLNKKFGTNFPS